ncbi:hypothetical protein [Nocardioides lijunqiniae]|uniref:hypothetical protein n=1 Tax=Nocardioides lijunqiniae TaxID=2760832 RepID=UPI001877821B|nr:hypothetical protein [Nocardioides lijunqiniae]
MLLRTLRRTRPLLVTALALVLAGAAAPATAAVRAGSGDPAGLLQFTSAPSVAISGALQVGRTMTATVTRDSDPVADTYEYQWARLTPDDFGYLLQFIPGADTPRYEPTAGDLGSHLLVTVTAQREGFDSTFDSAQTQTVVAPGTFTSAPAVRVTGAPRVGRVVRAAVAAALPAADTTTYRWTRDGVTIAGATAATYRAGARDLGALLRVVATAHRSGYARVSAASVPVKVGLPAAVLAISAPATARAGTRTKVTLTRLARGEAWTLRMAGRVLARGKADASGAALARVRLPRAAGRRVLTLTGSYADRTATRRVKVTAR